HYPTWYMHYYQKPAYIIWCGYAFETICMKHVAEMKRALKIEGVSSKNYTWRNSKAQVDMVIDRDDHWINLCEMKFSSDVFAIDGDYLKQLETKKREFKKDKAGRKGIFMTMMTTHGIKSNQYSTAIVDHDLTIACLFK
ncbi:MAG: ATPase, partial [Bacteroidota bacterium]